MEVLIVFLPLLGAILAGFLGRVFGDRFSQLATCSFLGLAAILSVIAFFRVVIGGESTTHELFTWIDSGGFEVSWALRIDALSAVMLVVVTVCSTMIHIYAIGYMSRDKSISRFFAYLSLFTFFMLMLVTADNFAQLFFGWEGVGLASYLLIGFWHERPSACAAAIKAFLVNRVGDVGFALGIAGCFVLLGSVEFDNAFAAVPGVADAALTVFGIEGHALTIVCILLFIGAMGKSAQLGLHTWLPDAVEGPAPVSALIHAATMVTAGVFMICRLSPIFEYAPVALELVTYVGALTAFFAATVGLVQNDIKRVIAYSTCSQLGYMFFAAGVSAYGAAMFHLFTHAFFKALLFMCAGSVIHAMSGEQDMRRMGGLWRKIPWTYGLMWVGSLSLAGVGIPLLGAHGIGFSGFHSMAPILEAAHGAHGGHGLFAFWLGIAAALMTAFYSWRLLIMTFHGRGRADRETHAQVQESPKAMILPLLLLAFGGIFAGYITHDIFVGDGRHETWAGVLSVLAGNDGIAATHDVPKWVKVLPPAVGLSGIALAYYLYMVRPGLPGRVAAMARPLYLFLLNKWYFDELYDRIFARPARRLGHGLWKSGDGAVIDGVGLDGVAAATRDLSRRASLLQSGYVYHYAFAMLIGVAVLVTWHLLAGSG